MTLPSELVAVLAGLGSAASWGTGDFSGGLATRKTNVYSVVVVSEIVGLSLLAVLAVVFREAFPPAHDFLWAAAAGVSGSIGLAALYQAMASGQMGIAAPVAAVTGAAIPVVVGSFLEGLPGPLKFVGFAVGLVGLWLITRPDKADGTPVGFRLSILAGLGFAGFFVFIDQASRAALFWPLVGARGVSFALMALIALVLKQPWRPGRAALPSVLLAGLCDVGGNVFYALAAQTGRLDVSAVLSSLAPMFTIALAMVVVKERLNRWQMAGIALMLVAIALFAIREGG